jgi:2-phospho-L-lactate guanylyltransferase
MRNNSLVAVVPFRLGAPRKSRLSGALSPEEREKLADQLFAHVTAVLSTHSSVARTIVLSPIEPNLDGVCWQADSGRGLNAELETLRNELRAEGLLVVHADLPFLTAEDVTAMISAAQRTGVAIAPDHSGTGTNAVAIQKDCPFPFAFGGESLAAHLAATGGEPTLVRRIGLALDIDRPEDLDLAESQGFVRNR